jgi:prepilin-type N-terminal cleavage/methylation domain-containing protein
VRQEFFMAKKRGFTLIELLVVIAIIALLLSILMPALRKVKEQGRSVVCRSNLHQWYLSMNLYASDYDGTFWKGWVANPMSDTNMWWSAMKVYHEDNNDIRCCPSADKPPDLVVDHVTLLDKGPGANRKPPFRAWGQMEYLPANIDADHGSYGCNGWLSNAPPAVPPDPDWDAKHWRKLARVTNTSRVPFMVDAQWTDHWPEPYHRPPLTEDEEWLQGDEYMMVRIVQNRHGKGTQNAIFMDGTAGKIGLKQMWTFKWYGSYDTKGEYTKSSGATRDKWPDWMQGFTDY